MKCDKNYFHVTPEHLTSDRHQGSDLWDSLVVQSVLEEILEAGKPRRGDHRYLTLMIQIRIVKNVVLILSPQKNIKHIQKQEKAKAYQPDQAHTHTHTHTPPLLIYYFVFVTCGQHK